MPIHPIVSPVPKVLTYSCPVAFHRLPLLLLLLTLIYRPAFGDAPPISLTNVYPPSTLLPPGSTAVQFSFQTPLPDLCGYSVGALLDFSQMQPVDTGTPIVAHQVTVTGLNPNPQIVNSVYIRCASASGN